MVISGKAFPARSTPYLMGVVNATPDSFYDGNPSPSVYIEHALALASQGADFLDIGGESTRPGSNPVDEGEELKRVLPVIRAVRKAVSLPLSIDTTKSAVADQALTEGCGMVNDVSAMTFDSRMADVVKTHGATIILMHMSGTPKTMQQAPQYDDPIREIGDYLLARAADAERLGIQAEKIFLDPGIGFGKRLEDNLILLNSFAAYIDGRYPVLIGHSRKNFIGRLLDRPNPSDRLFGSVGAALAAALHGAHTLRTHDVIATRDALRVFSSIHAAQPHVLV